MRIWVGTTRPGVVVLVAAFLTQAAAFLFDFPGAGLVAAVDLGWGFLDTAIFLVAVTTTITTTTSSPQTLAIRRVR